MMANRNNVTAEARAEHTEGVREHGRPAVDTQTYTTPTSTITETKHADTRGAEGFTGDMTNVNRGAGQNVCDEKFFTVQEDRPLVKEVKQYVREHHPVEREMVVETKTTGRERALPVGPSELIDVQERIVETTPVKPCP